MNDGLCLPYIPSTLYIIETSYHHSANLGYQTFSFCHPDLLLKYPSIHDDIVVGNNECTLFGGLAAVNPVHGHFDRKKRPDVNASDESARIVVIGRQELTRPESGKMDLRFTRPTAQVRLGMSRLCQIKGLRCREEM